MDESKLKIPTPSKGEIEQFLKDKAIYQGPNNITFNTETIISLIQYYYRVIPFNAIKEFAKKFNLSDSMIEEFYGLANKPRFFLDKRSGCAAIRDRHHPKYNKNYQGLNSDTPDVVKYIHGFQNHEKESWDIKIEDLEYLEYYCDFLNGV